MNSKIRLNDVPIIFVLLLSLFAFKSKTQYKKVAREEAKKIAIKNMIDSQHFVFTAESVSPLRGSFRQLNSEYDVQIGKNGLVSYLPFFGRAYAPPINATESDLSFNSKQISYSVEPYKKHGWTVTIKPKNNNGVQQYIFTIFDDGTANLNVSSISMDAISISGYIDEERKKKK